MIETRIVKCNSCHHHTWAPTNLRTVLCLLCKQVISVPGNDQPSRVFHVRDLNARFGRKISEIPDAPRNCDVPRKRAVLCGVSYDKSKYKLKGTIDDVKRMRDLLINKFKFPKDCILQLTDEDSQDPKLVPTKQNLEKALKWLVKNCCSGDSLVFYFAGHGSQKPDVDSDEIDGFDETICPLDFQERGMILDDDINSIIVRPLVAGVTLHAIIDACHSATMLDLPFMCSAKEKRWEDNNPPSGAYKGTSGGLAICISACRDDQKIVDSSVHILSGKTTLTHHFIQETNKIPGLTYGALITSIQKNIDEALEAPGVKTWFIRKFFKAAFSPEVHLSSSAKFGIYEKEFKL